jgi:hypothetical protein
VEGSFEEEEGEGGVSADSMNTKGTTVVNKNQTQNKTISFSTAELMGSVGVGGVTFGFVSVLKFK